MLSIGKLGAGQERYYLDKVAEGAEDYYSGEGEAEAEGYWLGDAAADLGLQGKVEPDQLVAMLTARNPATGEPFASFMIAAGVNPKALSVFMGHSSIKVTFDLYGHLIPGTEAEAAALLDCSLGAQVGRRRELAHSLPVD
jgi:TrwC relaxase.